MSVEIKHSPESTTSTNEDNKSVFERVGDNTILRVDELGILNDYLFPGATQIAFDYLFNPRVFNGCHSLSFKHTNLFDRCKYMVMAIHVEKKIVNVIRCNIISEISYNEPFNEFKIISFRDDHIEIVDIDYKCRILNRVGCEIYCDEIYFCERSDSNTFNVFVHNLLDGKFVRIINIVDARPFRGMLFSCSSISNNILCIFALQGLNFILYNLRDEIIVYRKSDSNKQIYENQNVVHHAGKIFICDTSKKSFDVLDLNTKLVNGKSQYKQLKFKLEPVRTFTSVYKNSIYGDNIFVVNSGHMSDSSKFTRIDVFTCYGAPIQNVIFNDPMSERERFQDILLNHSTTEEFRPMIENDPGKHKTTLPLDVMIDRNNICLLYNDRIDVYK